MNNGEILEIGVSVDDITDFYNEVVNDINKGFEDLEIYSKYYKPLVNRNNSLTETEKEFFRESIRDKKIIIKNKTPLRAVFYMASKSEYGNKYFKVTFLNSRFGIIFIFYFIIILLMFLIINFIKKRMKNNLVEIIEPIVNISGDMENFAENKESTFKAETTNIKEIDMIADNYLKMSQEINASFEELKAINEELNDSYRENTALISKIDKITDIIINLKRYRSTENFLSTVFRYITDFVPEVDYGLVTRIYQGKVNFIDGIGYDTEELNKINIPEESYIIRKNIEVIEINDKNIESINKSVLQEDKYEKLLKHMKPVKKTLYIPVITDKKFYGGITLQIAKDSEKNFTADIYKFSNYFSRLINLYLSVKEYGDDIRNSYRNFSSKLAMVAEAHDNETGKHIYRVGALSEFIACKMGFSKNFVKEIKDYAPLHDIGKIYVPIDILRKNGRLTSEEWDIMKKHTIFAERLLGDDVYFKTALNIAMYHHEKYDGSGYPFGMKGDEIPIEAQIVAIIDVYDALRSDRPYKAAITHEKTIEIILSSDERTNINHFNPKIVKIFEENQNEIRMLWEKINLE
ncbi:MAG: HD-GYP domain-containing protein [Thermotogae bacterium]|nr:HD-GYP domain-containing protein [Thermotogota bacterium]